MALAIASSVHVETASQVITLTSPSITCPAGGRLWVFSGWDSSERVYNISSSPALTWNVVFTNVTSGKTGGDSRIWYADCPAGFTGTITIDKPVSDFSGCQMYVMAVTGGEAVPLINTSTLKSQSGNPPNLSITTTQANSLVVAIGTNWTGGPFGTGDGWHVSTAVNGADKTALNNGGANNGHWVTGQYQSVVWRENGLAPVGTYTFNLDDGQGNLAVVGDLAIIEIREAIGPVVTAELWEAGSLKTNLGTFQVSADGVLSIPWRASSITDQTGAGVELLLTSDIDLDIEAIEWNALTATPPTPAIEGWGVIMT